MPASSGRDPDDYGLTKWGYTTLSTGYEDYVVTEKMDGGNLTMTRDHMFARSLDSGTHPWDTFAKGIWAQNRFNIPVGWRVSGESLYARRSVPYDSLEAYYLVFGMWDENDMFIDWDRVQSYAQAWGFKTVPELYRGPSFKDATKAWDEQRDARTSEGYVIRDAGDFHISTCNHHMGKWVRRNHVQTSDDWRHRDDFELNGLKK